ncbi:IS1380 family transposase [Glaciihabitans sp. UYNi722]|uniref:IS1380 family transposase n=1 Tax=Glaciihabitans sp. UYNi722 TaxID=3156344 RepID=UPI0033984370
MQVSHMARAVSGSFDDPNLVSVAGLVPVMKLAEKAGLRALAQRWLSVPTDKGANAGLKVASLVGGMVAGADSIDDMALLRHGGMRKLFNACYAPSTLGSFLRSFTFGHVRQLDAVASRFLGNLTEHTPLLVNDNDNGYVFLDVDDTIIEVHGYQKQGSGYGYSGVRGLNALLATLKTSSSAPIVVAQRLRRGACGSPRGAGKLTSDALATIKRLRGTNTARILARFDSAFYGYATINAAIKAGAAVSVTARMDPAIKRAIGTIPDGGWEAIEYTDAIYDETSKTWISNAEVAEIAFTAFTSRKKSEHIIGRLVVRRIPELNKKAGADQPTLFDTHRFHAFFTTSDLDTVTADKTHRGHAIIEQVNADLKGSALAHLPSGVFTANAAWLTLAAMAFNLTRAAATVAGTGLAKATTATIRRKLISIPARIATSARRISLHLPMDWPWKTGWTVLFDRAGPPIATTT